ncbi:MAG: flagellar export protein FliJ [Chloroflexi bacterium]|nr:flagellar export protein FliJ [Chloroflexota bacterium]
MHKRRFRLQPVLKYRERLEQASQLEFATAAMEHQQESMELAQLEQKRLAGFEELGQQEEQDTLDIHAIAITSAYMQTVSSAIDRQAKRVSASTEKLASKRGELMERSKDKKSLELLRARQKAEFEREMEISETKLLDEMATNLYIRQSIEGEKS